jgi:hypothetical protein
MAGSRDASASSLIAEGLAVIVMSSLAAMALRRTGYRQPLYAASVVMAGSGYVMRPSSAAHGRSLPSNRTPAAH